MLNLVKGRDQLWQSPTRTSSQEKEAEKTSMLYEELRSNNDIDKIEHCWKKPDCQLCHMESYAQREKKMSLVNITLKSLEHLLMLLSTHEDLLALVLKDQWLLKGSNIRCRKFCERF